MKKIFLMLIPLLIAGCRAHLPVAQESGKEDIAFLLFVSDGQYAGDSVQVKIDEATPFTAKVIKQKKSNRRGVQYGVSVGAKNLIITHEGKILYQKKIFLSTQEVKQIILP